MVQFAPWSPPVQTLTREEVDRLGNDIAELGAQLTAAEHRWLRMVALFDREHGWAGFRSCADWLSWRSRMSLGTAREKVRVARALEALPLIAAAMGRGELSYSQVRALTRIATAANEEQLMEVARHASGGQLETIVRCWRRIDRLEEAADAVKHHEQRAFTMRLDDRGGWEVRGYLPPESGAVLRRALDALADSLYRRDDTAASLQGAAPTTPSTGASFAQRRADALTKMAEMVLSHPQLEEEAGVVGSAERYQVVLHVDAAALMQPAEDTPTEEGDVSAETQASGKREDRPTDTLPLHNRVSAETRSRGMGAPNRGASAAPPRRPRPGDGQLTLADGTRLPPSTARAIACDATTVVMRHDSAGNVLDVGRRTRIVPAPIRRALEARDRGCVFPGCGNRFCQSHHVRHWADGGATKLDNLVLLCHWHHGALHRGDFTLELDCAGALAFTHRCGWRIDPVPAAPRVIGDPVETIRQANAEAGVRVNPATSAPPAGSARMDLHWVMRVVRSWA